ncbi:MAG: SEC-C metal-binding domain-containing protein [Gammaproteobacteria bacterium]|nr:SEC-C metal-binding domain-containing protein [Gammaproteobacteria bacterium]
MANFDTDLNEIPFELEALVSDAVGQILSHENPQLFVNWMREHIYDYYTGPEELPEGRFSELMARNSDQIVMDSDMARSLAANFASMIWNGVPLPSNLFRPRPMPTPKRNDRCHCGSDKKYKNCCARLPSLPSLSTNELWPIVYEKLDKDIAAGAIRENRVPLDALNMIAQDYLESEQPKKAVALLKPLFEGEVHKTNDDAEFALTLLCNAYDYLGHHRVKIAFLRAIIDTVPRSPLRSGAWQRQATIRMDNGDPDGAWLAFRNAQRDDPDSISLSVLEVQILNAQGHNEKSAERADFWIRRLRRAGLGDDEMPLNFLIEVAKNPSKAFADISLEMINDAGLLLRQWLESVLERPLPTYTLSDSMAASDPDDAQMVEVKVRALQTPDKLRRLELDWHGIYPMDKPFSLHEIPFEQDDPWEVIEELEWSGWLQRNPAAFDSLDILDDLATALIVHPQFGARWLNDTLFNPILQRAEAILEKVLVVAGEPRLDWIIPENRPALRSLSRLVNLAIMMGENDEIERCAQRMISINPNDNHGYRLIVMNQLIHESRDREALQLAESFPNDSHPEVAFGRVLALYRLGRVKEAEAALGESLELLDKIPRYLLAKRIKKPTLDPEGVVFGGDDQAWYYRKEMRAVWQSTPGALDWLKKTKKTFS